MLWYQQAMKGFDGYIPLILDFNKQKIIDLMNRIIKKYYYKKLIIILQKNLDKTFKKIL